MKTLHYLIVILLLSMACTPRYAYLLRESLYSNKDTCFYIGDLFSANEILMKQMRKELYPRRVWNLSHYTYSFELCYQANECEGVYYYKVYLPAYGDNGYRGIPILKYNHKIYTWHSKDFENILATFFSDYPEISAEKIKEIKEAFAKKMLLRRSSGGFD